MANKKGESPIEKKVNRPQLPKEKPVEKNLRAKKKLRRHGGGAAVPVPIDFLRELGWHPGDCEVIVSLHPKKLVIEKHEKGEKP